MRIGDFKRKSRVIVVDDNYDHASGIRELINLENDYEVIANAANVNIALVLIKKHQPDLVLMDINMPEVDGITGIQEIEKLGLGTKVIALTGYDDVDLIYRTRVIVNPLNRHYFLKVYNFPKQAKTALQKIHQPT